MSLKYEFKKQGDFLFKYRSYLPIVIIIAGLFFYVYKEINLEEVNVINQRIYEAMCFLVCLFGFFIRFLGIGFAAEKTSGRNTSAGQIADSINMTGLYSLCCHPLYLGNFLIWLGIALFTQNYWFVISFALAYWLYYERIMYAEEDYLINKFNDDYLTYAKKVPAFIPNFRNWKKPAYSFSFKKIIKQEKSGILNLFFVILVMRATAEYFATNLREVEIYWIYGFALSVLWYIVIKIIQKKTDLLTTVR